jgi:hypothetical protein
MDLRTPMQLLRDGQLVGLITDYGYETPWATGVVEVSDPARGERCDRAVEFLQWLAQCGDELPDDNDSYEELYDRELARRDITRADIEWCQAGEWTILTRDGTSHPSLPLEFIGDCYVQWRW